MTPATPEVMTSDVHAADGADTGIVPERTSEWSVAAEILRRDGAAIVEGCPTEPASLVHAAARLLGTDLRRVEPVRRAEGDGDGVLGPHTDGATVTYRTRSGAMSWRVPDDDVLLQLCAVPAPEGGHSVLLDGYALVDEVQVTRPALGAFLTDVDLDYLGGYDGRQRGANEHPFVGRTVEHTRAGRRIVTVSDLATPLPRHPDRDTQAAQLDEWLDVVGAAFAAAPRFLLGEGDLLCVDNYRVVHGRDAYRGQRLLHVMTARSAHAA